MSDAADVPEPVKDELVARAVAAARQVERRAIADLCAGDSP